MKLKALESIERIFVTCSMTPPSADIGVQELASAHRRQGYSAIAVHYVIRQDGTVPDQSPSVKSVGIRKTARRELGAAIAREWLS